MQVFSRFCVTTLFFLFVFALGPGQNAWAVSPYGLVAEYGTQDPEDDDFCNDNYMHFAAYKMLTDTPITYAIKFDDYAGRTAQTDAQWTLQTDALIRAAFYRWPNDVEKTIRTFGRSKEFQDVLTLLKQHPLILQRTGETEADIVFHFDKNKSADFLYNKEDLSKRKAIRIENPAQNAQILQNLPSLLTHEIGHYYGLGDRYQEGITDCSPLYSTSEGIDGLSLMATAKGPGLAKDDVDGFINLIDVTLAFDARKFSERSERGWTSFDFRKRMFARGKELNRQAFFDGTTIYYYNEDGSIKKSKEAKTVEAYNPFAEEEAKQGPFQALKYVPSADTDMETVFNYLNLNNGHISGKSMVANLTLMTFTISRIAPKKWNLRLNYERDSRGFNEKRKYLFVVQQLPETCRISISQYDYSLKNVQVEIDPITSQFTLQAQALDLSDDSTPYNVSANGTEEYAKFTYTQGNNTYQMWWKNDFLYDNGNEQPSFDNKIFFVTENIRWVRDLLNDEYHFCQYLSALKK